MSIKSRVRAWANDRYPDVYPWWLRWALPLERPMLLIVGRRGKGKTLLATKIARDRMLRGERVYANYGICDQVNGVRAGRIWSMLDTLDLHDCTVVIDEANQFANAREFQAIPAQVISEWQESRKSRVDFIFTAQHETRVDVIIRELVDHVLIMERIPLIPKWWPLFRVQQTYLEEITDVRSGKVSRASIEIMRHPVFAAYDTRERIANDPKIMKALREYKLAVKGGMDPFEARQALGLPDRVEPSRRLDSGDWVSWDWCESSGADVAPQAV